ncbi:MULTISPECIES: LysR family transcriptional regulator [unclassified Variovorax]|uniref:LysR family transcriptional regulator n=1 Tax=unclassified Variovorax TaxID=663243 RepID=UPI001BD31BFB|nr:MULTISPECIES: LysR family transcriptional regulator [unclassified Variovorax]
MPLVPQNFQTLRCFAAVARAGSISVAAQTLHLSQPAVSLQIKSLESLIGLVLFHRSPSGLVLTTEGARLLLEADKTLLALEGFGQQVAKLKGTHQQMLRIGTILDAEVIKLASFLKELVSCAPKAELRLTHCMSDEVLMKLSRQELDVGYCLELPPAGGAAGTRDRIASPNDRLAIKTRFHSEPLRNVLYRVAAPAQWEARVRGKNWKSLAKLPWVSAPEFSAHSWLLTSVFSPLGITPQRSATSDREASMLDLVESGVGLSLVRDSIAEAEAAARHLVIADRVSIECQLRFVSLQSRLNEQSISQAWSAMRHAWSTKPRARRPAA